MKRGVGSVLVGTVPNEEAVPPIRAIISIKVSLPFVLLLWPQRTVQRYDL